MKILIIEDSPLYQKIHVKHLKKHLPEAEFMIAGNGWEGYELYLKEKADFIVLDLLMPVMNGLEFLKLFKEKQQGSTTKIVVLSADVQRLVQEEVLTLGAAAFFQKPLTEDKAGDIAGMIRGETHVE